nr:HNH endonuclease signature motif containing protein [Achromobacter sp. ACRQX]
MREDFYRKCGYCDTIDFYFGGVRGFHIDHFAPKKLFVTLADSYDNLVYCCPICNIGKSDDWPSTSATVSYVDDCGYIDPCSEMYIRHLGRAPDGKIVALTPLGAYMHKRLKLHLVRRQLCWLLERIDSQLISLADYVKNHPENTDAVLRFTCLFQEFSKYSGILKRD